MAIPERVTAEGELVLGVVDQEDSYRSPERSGTSRAVHMTKCNIWSSSSTIASTSLPRWPIECETEIQRSTVLAYTLTNIHQVHDWRNGTESVKHIAITRTCLLELPYTPDTLPRIATAYGLVSVRETVGCEHDNSRALSVYPEGQKGINHSHGAMTLLLSAKYQQLILLARRYCMMRRDIGTSA